MKQSLKFYNSSLRVQVDLFKEGKISKDRLAPFLNCILPFLDLSNVNFNGSLQAYNSLDDKASVFNPPCATDQKNKDLIISNYQMAFFDLDTMVDFLCNEQNLYLVTFGIAIANFEKSSWMEVDQRQINITYLEGLHAFQVSLSSYDLVWNTEQLNKFSKL